MDIKTASGRRDALNYRTLFLIGLFSFSITLGMLTGCQSDPKTSDQDLTQLEYPAFLNLKADPKRRVVIVDVRIPERYAEGHIPGAINISIPDLRAGDERLAEATDIVVYATGWTEYLSPAAAKKLLALKYENVYDFRGGIEMWQAYGGKVVQ
jgi:rhodanese-related sulfurtransferase